jgi:hypothetical protein
MPQERALPADAVGGDDCLRNMHALPADAVGGDGGDSEGLRLLVMATPNGSHVGDGVGFRSGLIRDRDGVGGGGGEMGGDNIRMGAMPTAIVR